jgi:hypothetical protein
MMEVSGGDSGRCHGVEQVVELRCGKTYQLAVVRDPEL